MSHDVFICHSSEDKSVAESICTSLETNGISCWIAPRNILAGESWGGAIIDAIRNCPIMIFIFSMNSNKSQHVLRELRCAVDNRKYIIPFRIEKADLSASLEYFIAESQWFDALPKLSDYHLQTLSTTIQQLLEKRGLLSTKAVSSQESEKRGYQEDLQSLSQLLHQKQWDASVRFSSDIFQRAMKELVRNIQNEAVDDVIHEKISSVSQAIDHNNSNPQSFDLDQLLSLFHQADLFSFLRIHLTSNLQKIKDIDWNAIMAWHKASREEKGPLQEKDAMQMAHWLRIFLFDCELIGQKMKVAPLSDDETKLEACSHCQLGVQAVWKYCPHCGWPLRVTCNTCRRPLAHDFKICPYCETPLPKRGDIEDDEVSRAREEYRILCVGAYIDGVLNIRERQLLDKKRLELGLSAEDALQIERQCAPPNVVEYTRLVEGVFVDGLITEEEAHFLQQKAREFKLDSWVAEQIVDYVVSTNK